MNGLYLKGITLLSKVTVDGTADPIQKFVNTIYDMVKPFTSQPVLLVVAAIMVILIGVLIIIPGRKANEAAGKIFIKFIVAIIILTSVGGFANYFINQLSF